MEPSYLGYTAVFKINKVKEASNGRNFNLDDFLSFYLLKGFSLKGKAHKSLIWFFVRHISNEQSFIGLSIGSQKPQNLDWLVKIPGFFESGEESIDPKAKPYALWDDKKPTTLAPDRLRKHKQRPASD
jgi:hypothetical protein